MKHFLKWSTPMFFHQPINTHTHTHRNLLAYHHEFIIPGVVAAVGDVTAEIQPFISLQGKRFSYKFSIIFIFCFSLLFSSNGVEGLMEEHRPEGRRIVVQPKWAMTPCVRPSNFFFFIITIFPEKKWLKLYSLFWTKVSISNGFSFEIWFYSFLKYLYLAKRFGETFILQGNKNIETIVKERRREEVGKW